MAGRSEEDYRDRLLDFARGLGFAAVGLTTADPFPDTLAHLEERRELGLHAGMQFTYRNPRRATTPAESLPGAATLVVGAWRYGSADGDVPTSGAARVARFARNRPYEDLRAALDAIAARLIDDGHRARVLVDDNALVDRAAAYRAGLGWWGKNTNLLLPAGGSWHLLGSVLTDVALPVVVEPLDDGCGSCRRCLDACPTGALDVAGVLDAGRCLTWLLQARGSFPREHRIALGDRIYGCDDCQIVCPPSRPGLSTEPDPAAWLDVVALLGLSDAELIDRVEHWYIPGRQARFVRRNLLVVLGNVGDPADAGVRSAVDTALEDPDPLLRAHAVWAARRLGLDAHLGVVSDDTDPLVREELAAALP